MFFNNIFIQTLFIYNLVVFSYILRRPCTLFAEFTIQQQNKYMRKLPIGNISNIEYDACLIRCVQTDSCTSINHEVATKFCELLQQYLSVPETRAGWKYYATDFTDPRNIGGYCIDRKPCAATERCNDACTPQKYECIPLPNIALGKTATGSSVYPRAQAPPSQCIDGNFITLCHTNQESFPWLKVDLGTSHRIIFIRITGRNPLLYRISGYNIYVGNTYSPLANQLFKRTNQVTVAVTYSNFAKIFRGRYVTLKDQVATADFLDFAEIEILGIKSSEFGGL